MEAVGAGAIVEVSLAEAAIEVDDIELSVPLSASNGSITLGRGFERDEDCSVFAQRPITATVRNFRLQDVHFDSAAMTLFHNGKKIRDTRHLVPQDFYENARIADDPIRLVDGVQYVMARAHTNYFHWLIETIPAVDWSLQNIPGERFGLLCGPLNRWQQETLALLGYADVARVDIDFSRHYWVPRLSYSEFQSGVTSFEVSRAAQATFDKLAAASEAIVPTADFVYIARTDTRNRPIENEDHIIQALDAEGVRAVAPGSYTVAEQIAIFRKAKCVIGPHGAGLANIVFCQPGTFVYEVVAGNYRNPCFNRLAQAAGLHYLVDASGPGGVHDPSPHAQQWSIDVDLLLHRVRQLRERITLLRPRPQRSAAMEFLKSNTPLPARSPSGDLATTQYHVRRETMLGSWLRRLFK